MSSKPHTLQSIQCLRGIAALLVVFHHTIRGFEVSPEASVLFATPWMGSFPSIEAFGSVGVDLFFVISGFIMVIIADRYLLSEHPCRNFLARRLIRIYPLYLLVTLLFIAKTCLAYWVGAEQSAFDLQTYRLLAAVFFVPTYNIDHSIQPILGVGWTLAYEMLFYFLFSIGLLMGKKVLIPFVLLSLLALMIIPLGGDFAIAEFFNNPLSLEFVFGMLIAGIYLKLPPVNRTMRDLLLITALSVLFLTLCKGVSFPARMLWWGIPVALLVYVMVSMERHSARHYPEWLMRLGDVSYSLYLTHVIVVYYLCFPLLIKLKAGSSMPWVTDVTIVIIVSLSVGFAYFVFRYLERPLYLYMMGKYINWSRTMPANLMQADPSVLQN